MTNLSTLKVAVLGARRVGKSALTVRHLTKRYIGEYRSNIDLFYKQTILIDDVMTEVEILDISRWTGDEEEFPEEHVRWADCFLVVYSVCDRTSLLDARELLQRLSETKAAHAPVTLLGNKRDLEHCRQVSADAGRTLAVQYGCQFGEASAADNYASVSGAFEGLLRQAKVAKVQNTRQRHNKLSMLTVSRVLGAIIGHGKNTVKKQQQQQNNRRSAKQRPSHSL